MKSAPLALLLLLTAVSAPANDECGCVPAPPSETTHYGGNQAIVIHETKSYPSLEGIVSDQPGFVLKGVLVEVFDHPEWLLLRYPESEQAQLKQQRIATYKTGADGKFCFVGLPRGNYELRFSIGSGWDVTHVYVTLASSHLWRPKKSLKVNLRLGT